MQPPQSSLETPKETSEKWSPIISPGETKSSHVTAELTDFLWELPDWYISCVSRSGGWLDKLLHSEAEECLWRTVHREDETQRCGQMPEGVYEFRWEMKPISQLCNATPRKHVNIRQLWKAGLSFHEKHILQERVKSATHEILLSSCLVTVENY